MRFRVNQPSVLMEELASLLIYFGLCADCSLRSLISVCDGAKLETRNTQNETGV